MGGVGIWQHTLNLFLALFVYLSCCFCFSRASALFLPISVVCEPVAGVIGRALGRVTVWSELPRMLLKSFDSVTGSSAERSGRLFLLFVSCELPFCRIPVPRGTFKSSPQRPTRAPRSSQTPRRYSPVLGNICWYLLVSMGSCGHLLVFGYLLVFAGICGYLLVFACICNSFLVSAGICWYLRVSAGICRYLKIFAGICWYLLVSAGICLYLPYL